MYAPEEAEFSIDKIDEGLLTLGERFLEANLTPIFYKCTTTNVYYIVKFEQANYGYH